MSTARGAPTRWAMAVLCTLGWLLLLAPVAVVTSIAFGADDALTFPPRGLSTRWFLAAADSAVLMRALAVSSLLALCASALAVVIGTLAALGAARLGGRRATAMAAVLTAPVLLPGLVIGFAIYVFYVAMPVGLTGTFAGLLLGHVVIATPWVITTVLATLHRIPPDHAEVARSLGAGPFRVFWRITLPALMPGIVAGALMAFVSSFAQFDVSLFLGVSDATPLPIAIFTSLMNRGEPVLAAMGVLAILVVVVGLLLVNLFQPVSVLFGGSRGR